MIEGPGRRHFHQRIESLERATVAIGHEVARSIPEATEAWLRRDCQAGGRVDARTAGWSERARDVELTAYEQIATQQPMGVDLRRLMALVRLAEDVSRSGDLVAHVARSACFDRPADAFSPALRSLVVEMAALASGEFVAALEAFAAEDEDAGKRVEADDAALDALHQELLSALLAGDTEAGPAIDLALLGRFYERIGDHAVEIARRVSFVSSGALPGDS
ncbi:MAG TPA: PhoU domain-containing protein [Acidimicrobiales bacterium]|nr:PhoU domain-containing protein [Acidimicrobiales bacterium]